MLKLLIDNTFTMFDGRDFQRVGIPIGIPLLAESFIYSQEGEFMQELLMKNK